MWYLCVPISSSMYVTTVDLSMWYLSELSLLFICAAFAFAVFCFLLCSISSALLCLDIRGRRPLFQAIKVKIITFLFTSKQDDANIDAESVIVPRYFKSFWNWTDLLTYFSLLSVAIIRVINVSLYASVPADEAPYYLPYVPTKVERSLLAVVAVLYWAKFTQVGNHSLSPHSLSLSFLLSFHFSSHIPAFFLHSFCFLLFFLLPLTFLVFLRSTYLSSFYFFLVFLLLFFHSFSFLLPSLLPSH